MLRFKAYTISIVHLVIFMLSVVTDWYRPLSLVLLGVVLLSILDKLGKGILLREIIALHGIVVCLVMPVLGYAFYTYEYAPARIWVKYMPVHEQEYFSFCLPAIAAFTLAICWPVLSRDVADDSNWLKAQVVRAREILEKKTWLGFTVIAVGLLAFLISPYVPAGLQFVVSLLFWTSFAGALYVYFTNSFPYRKLTLTLFTVFVMLQALQGGMFTMVVYMSMTIFSFFFLGKKIAFWKKLTVMLLASFILIVIQNVKSTYRLYIWRDAYSGNNLALFAELVYENLTSGKEYLSESAFFPIYTRANQGFNVALVMRRIPRYQPHDGGKALATVAASSIVPRVLWSDKPEAGGKFNMKYYAGVTIRRWSTNVGPLGEAYGGFGVNGGIIYMFCLGAFIRFSYRLIFSISRRVTLLIFWIPVLFYQVAYGMETDTLQILNSLIKGAVFTWGMYKLFPGIFGIAKKQYGRYKTVHKVATPANELPQNS